MIFRSNISLIVLIQEMDAGVDGLMPLQSFSDPEACKMKETILTLGLVAFVPQIVKIDTIFKGDLLFKMM